MSVRVFHERGMVLVVVLWVVLLISGLAGHLFFSLTLHSQSTKNTLIEAQRFQIAESALLKGEQALISFVLKNPKIDSGFILPSECYKGYHLAFNVVRLPQVFCFLPMRRKGHYYELTVTLKKEKAAPQVRLQSVIAIPSTNACTVNAKDRLAGRNAWCQLNPS